MVFKGVARDHGLSPIPIGGNSNEGKCDGDGDSYAEKSFFTVEKILENSGADFGPQIPWCFTRKDFGDIMHCIARVLGRATGYRLQGRDRAHAVGCSGYAEAVGLWASERSAGGCWRGMGTPLSWGAVGVCGWDVCEIAQAEVAYGGFCSAEKEDVLISRGEFLASSSSLQSDIRREREEKRETRLILVK